jgi:hypothetical protein
MSEKKIIITITPIGKPKIDLVGFQGIGCEQTANPYLTKLGGGRQVDVEHKPEVNMLDLSTNDQEELKL